MNGWEQHYPGMIEWIPFDIHGGIKNIDARRMEIHTDFDTFTADVACIIPAQTAGKIAMSAGVNEQNWCPINPSNMKSKADPRIYIIGDSANANAMPKSAVSANSQAKVVANSVLGELTNNGVFPARYANTCWSLIARNDGIKVGANYKAGKTKIEVVSRFISGENESPETRKTTYEESVNWYTDIITDMFS